MKRLVGYSVLILSVLVFFAAMYAGGKILHRPETVRWMFAAISRHTECKLSVDNISGTLASTVSLTGFSLQWKELRITAEELKLRFAPLRILTGTIRLNELYTRKVKLYDYLPDSASEPEILWPLDTGIPAFLRIIVDRLVIEGLVYENPRHKNLILPDITGAVDLQRSRAKISILILKTAQGHISGDISAGFGKASLDSLLLFEPLKPLSGLTGFKLKLDLRPGGSGGQQLAGRLNLLALADRKEMASLSGEIGLSRKGLDINNLSLKQHGRAGLVKLNGLIAASGDSRLEIKADALDVSSETGTEALLSGIVGLKGDLAGYVGKADISVKGKGWRSLVMHSAFDGDLQRVKLTGIDAAFAGGKIRGMALVDWHRELLVKAALNGIGLDPSRLEKSWKGRINLDLDSTARWNRGRLQQAEIKAGLVDSVLHGRMLQCSVDARCSSEELRIDQLLLNGKGFNIKASGVLSQRIDLSAKVSSLAALVPGFSGSLDLNGNMRYRSGMLSGNIKGNGYNLATDRVQLKNVRLNARLGYERVRAVDIGAEFSDLAWRGLRVKNGTIKADGLLSDHRIELNLNSSRAAIACKLSGGYAGDSWKGKLESLSGDDHVSPWRILAPVAVSVSPGSLSLSRILIAGSGAERLDLSGQLDVRPLSGKLQASWSELNLVRTGHWLSEIDLSGRSSGTMELEVGPDHQTSLKAHGLFNGTVRSGKLAVPVKMARLDIDADHSGTTASLDLQVYSNAAIMARFNTSEPAVIGIPDSGDFQASWTLPDISLTRQWLPPKIALQGSSCGRISGKLLPGKRFDLSGSASLADGSVALQKGKHQLETKIRKAGFSCIWRGNSLNGDIAVSLARLGETRGSFSIPLAARLGAAPDPSGLVSGKLNGSFHERGMLTTLSNGLLQDTTGVMNVDLRADGTWQQPVFNGSLNLARAGAYLPATGIKLEDIQMNARLSSQKIQVDSFQIKSGGGLLKGTAELLLAGNSLSGYQGTLSGQNFQASYLPELQMLISPELDFKGNLEKTSVRGKILIPAMQVNKHESASVVRPSKDVVVIGRNSDNKGQIPVTPDINLELKLGKQVHINVAGLDARLSGGIDIRISDPARVTGTGEIRVAKGSYSIYGTKLKIVRGRAIFAGGPVQQPSLDILALREVDDIKAGVTVTGTPEAPLIKLYSEPPLPDTDILSYTVLGRRLEQSGNQTALLMQAASMLVSSSRVTDLKSRIKQILPIDSVSISSENSNNSGYKTIEPSLKQNSLYSKDNTNIQQTMLQIGKYLTPKLYISYGRSLFDESQQFKARYRFSKQWEIETKTSTAGTGGDIFYRIELD